MNITCITKSKKYQRKLNNELVIANLIAAGKLVPKRKRVRVAQVIKCSFN